jgi:hypothetical protein
MRWRNVGDQGIARCTAYTFANPIQQAGGEDDADGSCHGKQWLGQRTQTIAEQGQAFALAEIVTQHTREQFYD